jgi:hypothetical protein
MSTTVLKQIAGLQSLSYADLQERWRMLIGNEPPRYSRDFMVRRLAHRLQELARGGMSQETRGRMDRLLAEAGYDELGSLRGGTRPRSAPNLPLIGTRLVREWESQRHEVTVVHGGFEYRGRRFRSLSAIAKLITGTHWNGPRFFGLRDGREARAR